MILGDGSAAALLPGGPQANWTTIDGLLQKTAARLGERLALVDDPDRPLWNRSPAERLTYAEAEARVARLADRFRADGLAADQILALETPATVDTVLALLAAFRAGLIAAPLPPLWRRRDSIANLKRLAPIAFVTTGMVDGDKVGTRGLGIASALPSIAKVYGLGSGLPEAISDLAESGTATTAMQAAAGVPDQLATITMTATGAGGEAIFHARSHAQWLAMGLATVVESRMPEGGNLLVPFSFSGVAGIGAGLVPWLLTGGTLHLHHFSGLRPLVAHVANLSPDFVLLPGAIAEPMVGALTRRGAARPAMLAAVWKNAHPEALPPALPSAAATKFIDITVLDELAFVARRRTERAPAGLPLGAIGLSSQSTNGPAMLETRLDGRPQRAGSRERSLLTGTIALRGAVLPLQGRLPLGEGGGTPSGLAADAEGFLRTDVLCRLSGAAPTLAVPTGREGDHVSVGGIATATAALDELYRSQPGVREAAAYVATGSGNRQSLRAAVVFADGAIDTSGAFRRSLSDAGASLHHLPEGISVLTSIPRTADGLIDRTSLAQAASPQAEPAKASAAR